MNTIPRSGYLHSLVATAALTAGTLEAPLLANPAGGTVAQGHATFTTQGSQLTIQTSDHTQINWSSFNIGLGETTTFLQPSSSSVVWNRINDVNPSQILGNLNANGYVVLQNSSGFYIGGQAVLSTHGLLMTTAPTPAPDLSGSGAWQFNALPPTASIINYGQLRQPDGDKGGSVYLIAADIQNNGLISAPQGNVGLYAGQQVLLSDRPDGRGLSARVTLPQGSVDNQGQIIADAGTIALRAQTVNQGGLVQANSVRNVNGVIELVASDTLNLQANSVLSAQGDASSAVPSQGGFVVARSDKTYTDTATSTINVAGQNGGRDGVVEVVGSGVTKSSILSQIDAQSAATFQGAGGWLLINPQNLSLNVSASPSSPSKVAVTSPTLNLSDLASFSKIDLYTPGQARVSGTAPFASLPDSPDPNALFKLTAGTTFTLNAPLVAGNNWSLALAAGPGNLTARPAANTDGIYLNGDAYLQTQNGSISLWAANDVSVNPNYSILSGIRTLNGGSIDVTAQFGDVNTGGNPNGFTFGPHYSGDPNYYYVSSALGGISTAAGGDVTINAGHNVTSYLPVQSDYGNAASDGGAGAFGNQPGNVTINAGGNVSGHYVLMNGAGSITAGGNVGAPSQTGGFALSLAKGNWSVYAPFGNIYVQDIRNPNGTFDESGGNGSYPWYHSFDYDPLASVLLDAGQSVDITGAGAPHTVPDGHVVPVLFPPSLTVVTGDSDPSKVPAGPFDFVLNSDVTLFPSPNAELNITTKRGGSFLSYVDPSTPGVVNVRTLLMSDSAATQWQPEAAVPVFGPDDHAPTAAALNDPNPVTVSVSGNIDNLNLQTTKATDITVGGSTYNFGFKGRNLHPGDVTSINVAGSIAYPGVYAFENISEPLLSASTSLSSQWDTLFSLLLAPGAQLQLNAAELAMTPAQLTKYILSPDSRVLLDLKNQGSPMDPGYSANNNPGFIYAPGGIGTPGKLGYQYQMSQAVFNALNQRAANDPNQIAIPILQLDAQGHVIVQPHGDGHYYLATTTTGFVSPAELQQLYTQSQQSVKDKNSISAGLQIAGPGKFNINAAALDLGSSSGIMSWGVAQGLGSINPALVPLTPSGAEINLNVAGDISLLTSTIASIYGGDLNVNSGGSLTLSLPELALVPPGNGIAYGIFTSGHSDVNVIAQNDINIGGARIAAFNGGNVLVRSEAGNVSAGNGINALLVVPVIRVDPKTGTLVADQMQNPRPFGSGIIALVPTAPYQSPGSSGLPGNITVQTPRGDITATLGGIQQYALNGSSGVGPSITLSAGTPAADGNPGYKGNIDLGQGGVIGGTINLSAQGNIIGLIVSRQDANVNATGGLTVTLLSGGKANVDAGGPITGTLAGVGGLSVAGGGLSGANLMGQNVSVDGGVAQSTLGTSAAATGTSQAAAQQSNNDSQQQLASSSGSDDDQKKKHANGGKSPMLVKHVGRVTVILPGS